jgi:hypothetical protein
MQLSAAHQHHGTAVAVTYEELTRTVTAVRARRCFRRAAASRSLTRGIMEVLDQHTRYVHNRSYSGDD